MPAMPETAFITGAASGIGLRLAELLAHRGARVAVLDRDLRPEASERLRAAVGRDEPRLAAVQVDVRDADAVEAAFAAAQAQVGPPTLVISSAGIQLGKAFADLSAEEFTRVIEVNLLGIRQVAACRPAPSRTWPERWSWNRRPAQSWPASTAATS